MGVQARCVLWSAVSGSAPDSRPPADRDTARRAADEALSALEALDAVMSDWSATSELARVCARAGAAPVALSADLWTVLARALAIAEASDGAFDPAAGALTKLWRAARARGSPPGDDALDSARARSGWRRVELDPRTHSVRFLTPGLELDLGAIGKGFAADRLLAILAAHGHEAALVDVGGDLALGSAPPTPRSQAPRRGWRVRLDGGRVLELAHCGVATSGDREQHLDHAGQRLSHIIDPRTGRALADSPSVTAIADDGATADALASLASVLGVEATRELVDRRPEVFGHAQLHTGLPSGVSIG